MSLKIKVNLEPSQLTNSHTFNLDDLNLTESEWGAMTKYEKEDVLQEAINDLNEQPYWMLDDFSETD